mmetsp:Transcript_36392/g.81834  ORF Transcript_36392/g.81834 Transcript_36392/m.81834 type:complete len:235 (+) Transcript_36392:1564-2268(+)
MLVKVHALACRLKRLLKPRNATNTAWDRDEHAAEFANQFMEVSFGTSLAADWEAIEHSEQSFDSVGGELDGASDGVNKPAQDDLQRRQRAIALKQFLQADFVFCPLAILVIRCAENPVDAVEQDAADPPAAAFAALDKGHEVVDIAVDVPQRALVALPDARRVALHRHAPSRVDVSLGVGRVLLPMGRRAPVASDLLVGDVRCHFRSRAEHRRGRHPPHWQRQEKEDERIFALL